MTEDEARGLMIERFGSNKVERVASFLALVRDENDRQNLIAPSTLPAMWNRHALDSAQLMFHVEQSAASWLDIGTGGGFPGLVIALLFDGNVTLVEPRRKRADFLQSCVDQLSVTSATVCATKVEVVTGRYDVISARAVASVENLLHASEHCATSDTQWILPRGRIEPEYLDALQRERRRLFHVKQSVTDEGSSILIVERNKEPTR